MTRRGGGGRQRATKRRRLTATTTATAERQNASKRATRTQKKGERKKKQPSGGGGARVFQCADDDKVRAPASVGEISATTTRASGDCARDAAAISRLSSLQHVVEPPRGANLRSPLIRADAHSKPTAAAAAALAHLAAARARSICSDVAKSRTLGEDGDDRRRIN